MEIISQEEIFRHGNGTFQNNFEFHLLDNNTFASFCCDHEMSHRGEGCFPPQKRLRSSEKSLFWSFHDGKFIPSWYSSIKKNMFTKYLDAVSIMPLRVVLPQRK